MNRNLKFFLKLFLSITILYFLIKGIDINQSIKTLSRINPTVFILMIIIYLMGQELCAKKWSIIAAKLGFKCKLSQYSSYYFTGMFFNLFLPTSVGGDATKAYYLYKNDIESSKIDALFSVFMDRLTGIIVLVFICFLGLFFAPAHFLSLYIKIFATLGFTVTLLLVLLFPKIKKINFLKKIPLINKFNICVDKIYNKSLIKIFILAIVFHVFMLVIHFCIGKTMGLNIPVSYYLILYPITAIISFLPISASGIGLREAAYIYLLNIISINPAQSLVFALCWFTVTFISSLFGTIFYIRNEH